MKVLLSDNTYAYLQPGGKNTHITKLLNYHNINGIECKFENFFESELNPDIVHFLGFNDIQRIKLLKKRGKKLILTLIVDEITNLTGISLIKRRIIILIQSLLPTRFDRYINWKALKYFDHIVFMHENDRTTALKRFSINPKKTSVIPHGVEDIHISKNKNILAKNQLISVGSITPRKNSALLAEICCKNNIPIIFIGSSNKQDEYFKSFIKNVDGNIVKYLDFVSEIDKQNYFSEAKGFVLLSKGESGCIAIYEAASFGLPIFISDLPWSFAYPESNLITRSKINRYDLLTKQLIEWTKKIDKLKHDKPSFPLLTWKDISKKYIEVYKSL